MYKKERRFNSAYNKKHFDQTLSKKKTVLSTLSYDRDRTKDTDMFYAAHNKLDKHTYTGLFNKPAPKQLYDGQGNSLGTGMFFKYRINNTLKNDMKVASEDTGAEVFRQLYKNNRDFYNFVHDENRLQKYFVLDKYKFKEYQEAGEALHKIRDENYSPTAEDLQKIYRMFNYVIPYDGQGKDKRGAKDVLTQRTKFFNELKKKGYGAVLDTNDAIYASLKTTSPVIVFDTSQAIPKDTYLTTLKDVKKSINVTKVRKFLNI